MCQLWVSLFQVGVIEMRGRNGVSMLFFRARYVVGNLVVNGTNPLRINANLRFDQLGAKETTEQTANF